MAFLSWQNGNADRATLVEVVFVYVQKLLQDVGILKLDNDEG